ncbi:hypothetical protein [Piscinibacter sp.]|uniref:hypothetical protein n=1 Tax=Piscinibacter sp. TaxID=1903157 RepID=UPI0039E41786
MSTVPDTSAAGRWQLLLLGTPRLLRDDASSAVVRLSVKDAALLAIVALDGPVAAERVAALVWPGADTRKADTSLRQRLFRLRRECGAAIVASGSRLALAEGVATDLAATLARIATDPDAGRDALLGDLAFDDWPELADWVRQARTRWNAR